MLGVRAEGKAGHDGHGPSLAGAAAAPVGAAVLVSHALQRELVIERADDQFHLSPHINVAKYWADVLHQDERASHPPQWCGAFCLWAIHGAGLGRELLWRFATATDKRSGFLWALHRTTVPQPGDVAYFEHWQHHALVRCMVGDDLFDSIDGNQGPVTPIKLHQRSIREATAFYSIGSLLSSEASP